MESVTTLSLQFSQPHFVGGVSIGLFAWLVSFIASKIAVTLKSIMS